MTRKSGLAILATLVIVGIAVSGATISGTTYTWEKTFEVSTPELECEIEVSECRVVGCPVKVWVHLKLDECGMRTWSHDGEDDWDDECEDEWERDQDNDQDCWRCRECGCGLTGIYSAHLYWWNATLEEWHHVMHLQEDTNVTLNCRRHVEMYWFVPKMEGSYKVVVHFTVANETYSFSSEN